MEDFKLLCIWLNAFLVLLYGCWFVETKTQGHTRHNHTNDKGAVFHHEVDEVQYAEASASVVYTLSGNDKNAPCVFPFIYDGMKFTECTYKDCKHNKPWCATTSNYDKDKKWGHCQTDADVEHCADRHSRCGDWARDGECIVSAAFMWNKCPRSCGLCTFGGNGRGRACKFPFLYKNKIVYDCLPYNKKTWCSTTTNYNKDTRWGYCLPKLFRDIRAVNRKYFHWGECDDQHVNCVSLAQNGQCKQQPEKMNPLCPSSCHKCAPEQLVTRKGCKDRSSSCAELAMNGECVDKPVFMFAFCRWSCRQCAKKSIGPTVRDRMPQECKQWAQNGDCYLHQEFMLQNCRESCMAGGIVNDKMCLDSVADCPKLAKEGYCTADSKSRRIMRRYCKYSCKWC